MGVPLLWEEFPARVLILLIPYLILLCYLGYRALRFFRLEIGKNKILKAIKLWVTAEVQGKQIPDSALALLSDAHFIEIKLKGESSPFDTARFLEDQGDLEAADYCYGLAILRSSEYGPMFSWLAETTKASVFYYMSGFSCSVRTMDGCKFPICFQCLYAEDGEWREWHYIDSRHQQDPLMHWKFQSEIKLNKCQNDQVGHWTYDISEEFKIDFDVLSGSSVDERSHTEWITFTRCLPACTLKGKELKAEAIRLNISNASKMKADDLRRYISLKLDSNKLQEAEANTDDDTWDIL
jgi:hypothetical protein